MPVADVAPHPLSIRMFHSLLGFIAVSQISLMATSLRLESQEVRDFVFSGADQLGFIMMLVVLARFALRIPMTTPAPFLAPWEKRASSAVNYGMYALIAIDPFLWFGATWGSGSAVGLFQFYIEPPFTLDASTGVFLQHAKHVSRTLLYMLFALHVGGLFFSRYLRNQPMFHRMVPQETPRQLINRVPVGGQMAIGFGAMITIMLGAGFYTSDQYKTLNRARAQFDATELLLSEKLRSAEAALEAALDAGGTGRIRVAATEVRSELKDLLGSLQDPAARTHINAAVAALGEPSGAGLVHEAASAHDQLGEAIAAQSKYAAGKRRHIQHQALLTDDLVQVSSNIAVNLCFVIAFMLARSILSGLGVARRMVQSIGEESVGANFEVRGNGQFAMLIRDMLRTRDLVAERLEESHRRQDEIGRRAMDREAQLNQRNAEEQSIIVQQVADALSALAAGRLDYRIHGRFPGEYDRIREDFNHTIAMLQGAMDTISRSSASIGQSSHDVAVAADRLEDRSEQQTHTLSDMATALDRMTAAVGSVADSASRGAQAVSAARAVAEESGRVVTDAVQAMDDIEKSSARIVEIIGVIDTFATRSNLLSLNARIEAARAGESGKGFAVVAQEVNGLARRAAEAAREIRGLIGESNRHVGNGVRLVQETGQALQQIVGEISQVDKIVAGVASSSRDQAVRLDRVNGEMRQLDRIAQENSAMVAQTSSALQSIKDNAATLDGLIKQLVHKEGEDEALFGANIVPISLKARFG